MSEPFLGEIRLFPYWKGAPSGWALCNGQELSIMTNQALFSILGYTYGGNGSTTFRLPDLNGRAPVHPGLGVSYGHYGGEQVHTLTVNEMPSHTHMVHASTEEANSPSPTGRIWPKKQGVNRYSTLPPDAALSGNALGVAGNNEPHENMQPYLVMQYCIALTGVFPSRN